MEPLYSPDVVADWFILSVEPDKGGAMTNLKLQKLVYYAQAWALAIFDEPLFDEECEAWAHGPVIPSLYHKYKEYGWGPLPQPDSVQEFDEDTEWLLAEVWKVYGCFDGEYLEQLTHNEDPWVKTRRDLPPEVACDRPISKDLMRDFYRSLQDSTSS